MFGPDKWDFGFGGIRICAVTYGSGCGTMLDLSQETIANVVICRSIVMMITD